ncbi:NAD-dependent succinate-semialdehyde dehydrogenase [Motiliproteus coralliicola]|uniref:NAD-dependent succinate-semialdehyde dehydrogenase n=1 Tax=Motiliproteus coralliicola TaxID=2283196 RepID=A0A369WDH1_9GAMM|nr:NAD-dependent succinate-semialdehyde dehydrogenase [Motiliproteus coralliicola]RDE19697.1 NAD-dependent succinate-semialdehyde dehydrogenase [Motiliproteus coralliicola]
MTIQLNDMSLIKTRPYVNGEWIKGVGTLDVTNPATGKLITSIEVAGAAETEQAIEAADKAMQSWKALPAKARADVLRAWYNLIMANLEDLAIIMTAEQGKVLAESRGEVAYAASFIEWFAEEGRRLYGDVIALPQTDRRGIVVKQPVGVVGAITPWNFPSAMITRKAGPALAVGCSIVIKPASETPLSALALAELADRAGLPAGLLNVVPGSSREIGAVITGSPTVRKFTFTGSTPVGKLLMKQCAETVKKVSMELGGNAPVIVFDDADLDKAVAGAAASKYRNSGQTCICVNRMLVQEGIYDKFVAKLAETVGNYKLGDGLEESNTHGPQVTAKAAQDIDSIVQDTVAQGANLLCGGKFSEQGPTFYEPTILTDVDSSMRAYREEIFGPVAPIVKFKTEEEAIAMANDTEFGLAAYIYTRDIGRSWRVSEGVDYGMVGVNEVAITSDVIPFGGMKESGVGREGSKYGIEDYIETKYICMGALDQ